VPAANHVDVEIVQDGKNYTWTDYRFGMFSGWVDVFHGGTGQVTVWERTSGGRGQQLLTMQIPLTPGPLVVVIKDKWPPTKPTALETIAASFVPPTNGSKVRLFNLAVGVKVAGLADGAGTQLVSDVKFSLGSKWVPVPASHDTFSASSSLDKGAALASATFTPPDAPEVFTAFFLGSEDFGYTLMPQIDAPEYGPCRPAASAARPVEL